MTEGGNQSRNFDLVAKLVNAIYPLETYENFGLKCYEA